MFVQKKYPEVEYTLHVELTEEDVKKLKEEAPVVDKLFYPTLTRLLAAIMVEADRPSYR